MDVSLIYPTVNPMQDKVRTLLATLTSSVSRDELKYRALKVCYIISLLKLIKLRILKNLSVIERDPFMMQLLKSYQSHS
jgi:hypothetical protein